MKVYEVTILKKEVTHNQFSSEKEPNMRYLSPQPNWFCSECHIPNAALVRVATISTEYEDEYVDLCITCLTKAINLMHENHQLLN